MVVIPQQNCSTALFCKTLEHHFGKGGISTVIKMNRIVVDFTGSSEFILEKGRPEKCTLHLEWRWWIWWRLLVPICVYISVWDATLRKCIPQNLLLSGIGHSIVPDLNSVPMDLLDRKISQKILVSVLNTPWSLKSSRIHSLWDVGEINYVLVTWKLRMKDRKKILKI